MDCAVFLFFLSSEVFMGSSSNLWAGFENRVFLPSRPFALPRINDPTCLFRYLLIAGGGENEIHASSKWH